MTDARPAPMEGAGAYNRSSRVQAAGLSPAVPWLEDAARAVLLPDAPAPIVIADYGASEGRNSLAPMTAAIAALRSRVGPARAIDVVHTDLPDNDWPALFRVLADDPSSYLRGDSGVYPAAIGRSFYEQILPAGRVTLGWSSWAVQWLSRAPCAIPDHVQAAYSRDAAARAAFAAQAAADWQRFVALRARELVPGGRLVVLTMACDERGDFGYAPLLAAMYAGLEALVARGELRTDELQRMTIPTVGRSAAELAAPFADNSARGGVALARLEIFQGEDRLWAAYARDRDATAFGAGWAAFTRASVFPTLARALDEGGAGDRAARFMDALTAEVATRLAAHPAPSTMPLARLELVKDA